MSQVETGNSSNAAAAAKAIILLGLLLMLAEIALLFACAKWLFVAINGN